MKYLSIVITILFLPLITTCYDRKETELNKAWTKKTDREVESEKSRLEDKVRGHVDKLPYEEYCKWSILTNIMVCRRAEQEKQKPKSKAKS